MQGYARSRIISLNLLVQSQRGVYGWKTVLRPTHSVPKKCSIPEIRETKREGCKARRGGQGDFGHANSVPVKKKEGITNQVGYTVRRLPSTGFKEEKIWCGGKAGK